ncbi:MAG TPA: SRPBCC domain-containing protein [Vicinamibacterales bacterium]|jgi:glutathione S-transferase
MNAASTAGDTIVQEITINAPANRVFEAFTNPTERVKWWNADDGRFRTTEMDSDLRPGGKWVMRGTRQDGSPFTVKGEYRAVDRPQLLEFTWLPDWQGEATESLIRVEFTEDQGTTHVRLTHSGLTTERSRTSHRGWPQILAWLRAYVEG